MKGKAMRASVSSDPRTGELGSLYVQLSDAKVAKTVPVQDKNDPAMLIGLDREGALVGFEVLSQKMLKEFCGFISRELPKPYRAQAKDLCKIG